MNNTINNRAPLAKIPPQQADHSLEQEQIWQFLIEKGREKTRRGEWERACIAYSQAYKIIEFSLCGQCQQKRCAQCEVKRFINTAEEYAYSMRKNNYQGALAAFVSQVSDLIAFHHPDQAVGRMTARLQQLAFSSDEQLEQLYAQSLAS